MAGVGGGEFEAFDRGVGGWGGGQLQDAAALAAKSAKSYAQPDDLIECG